MMGDITLAARSHLSTRLAVSANIAMAARSHLRTRPTAGPHVGA